MVLLTIDSASCYLDAGYCRLQEELEEATMGTCESEIASASSFDNLRGGCPISFEAHPKYEKASSRNSISWFEGRVFEKGEYLIQALETFYDSIDTLSLGRDYYPCGFGEAHNDDEHEELWKPYHGILNKFTSLRTVEIPANVLPSTLRELVIRDDLVALGETSWEDRRIYNHVHNFLPHWRTSAPHLRQITLRLWNGHYEQMYPENEQELYRASEGAGMHLKIITDDLSSALWAKRR